MKKGMAFMKKHPAYNATIHALGGVGIGVLIASPVAGIHPVRFGIVFLTVSILGHVYALVA
jgi:hypothetical protein